MIVYFPCNGDFPGFPGSDFCNGNYDFHGKRGPESVYSTRTSDMGTYSPNDQRFCDTAEGKRYIEASRACGASTYWIIMKGLVPNCLSTIIVLVTLGIPNAIMYEASLSFLGIGIQPPTPSWGNMISAAQTFISFRSVYSIMPGVAIMITVIAFNIFGDGLRDALDPKLKN